MSEETTETTTTETTTVTPTLPDPAAEKQVDLDQPVVETAKTVTETKQSGASPVE